MGYMRHHGFLVTTHNEKIAEKAHAKAVEIFGHLVSEVRESKMNGYQSFSAFAVYPDGSKEGWGDSNEGDKNRATFKAWLNMNRYEDGSTPIDWVEVQYGDDDHETCIIEDSDHPKEATIIDAVIMLPD